MIREACAYERSHAHPLSHLVKPANVNKPVSTGTTIMAVRFPGGVILGADSRTSAGSYVVNRTSRKISQIHDRIFVCRSGSAADTQCLASVVRARTSMLATELNENPRVGSIANMFRKMCYEYKDQMMAGVIIAGFDSHKGGQVYSIPLGGTCLEVPYAAGGSGSTYIWGLLDATYRPDMTEDECKAFVTKCIAHAIARDGSSGGMIRLVTVREEGFVEEVVKGNELPYGP